MLYSSAPSNRRNFVSSLGGGFGWLALQALEKRVHAEEKTRRAVADIDPLSPYAARRPHFAPRAKSVIFLFMVGGPSQIDTFDYKPLLNQLDGKPVPESIRSAVEATRHANVFHGCDDVVMRSPFAFQQHGESGAWVSELMPRIAKHVDDLCFIHSMQADSNNHAPASYQLHTGDIRAGKASLGSWVTYGLGTENADLPGYVVLFDAGPLGGAANYTNGFLPPAFQPTRMRDRGLPVLDLTPAEPFASEQRDAMDLLQDLNRRHRDQYPGFLELDARIASYELAYRMQSAALEVGHVDEEPQYIHALYGLDHEDVRTQSFSRKCLMARRLVERGVRFVQLYDMPDKDGWDAHDRLLENHTPRARWTDIGVAGLIADLKQRGLLDSTLVIWASEFGRTPMKQGNLGRQHNAAGFTLWMAGGGIRPGLHVGATDELGLMATERPVQFRDLHATILTALGIDFEQLSFSINGRDERITGVAGSAQPLMDILL
ncbi:MAG: DUF1501 domain-containing protein [Pirellula sp.]|nr:DUF1501 domain-containing protein [Pirellula sp.]